MHRFETPHHLTGMPSGAVRLSDFYRAVRVVKRIELNIPPATSVPVSEGHPVC